MGRQLTPKQRELLAIQTAEGKHPVEIATFLGCTSATVQKHLKSEDVRRHVEVLLEKRVDAAERQMAKVLLHADALVDADLADALDANCPHRLNSRHYLMDLFLSKQQGKQEHQVNVNVDGQVFADLKVMMGDISRVQSVDVHDVSKGLERIVAGSEALPSLSGDVMDPEPPEDKH